MNEVFKIIPPSSKVFWFCGGLALVLLLILCLVGYIAYSTNHVEFQLSPTELRIQGDIYGRRIPRSSLGVDQAIIVNLDNNSPYQPRWRMNGIGMPGYRSGWFKLKNREKALLFVTKSPVVYLPTRDGYSLMFSVQNPEGFLASLRE